MVVIAYEFDEEGNLQIAKDIENKQKLHKSTKTLLLLSNKIIEIHRKIVNWDTPKECNLVIIAPFNFNMKFLAKLFFQFKEQYPPLSKIKYDIKANVFTINIISGSKRCSFCKYFQEYLDKNLPQEIILTNNPCIEWTPDLKEKLIEDEYQKILDEIVKKRLEYFANTTSKYREAVLKRDDYRCMSCGTDGEKPYLRKNGQYMKNPLQIHHIKYNEDSPDSLITLCSVCHYKLHIKIYKDTGKWSSKTEDMNLPSFNKNVENNNQRKK